MNNLIVLEHTNSTTKTQKALVLLEIKDICVFTYKPAALKSLIKVNFYMLKSAAMAAPSASGQCGQLVGFTVLF
jgi:hypothetical protein